MVLDEPPHGVVYGLKFKAHETVEVFFGNKNSQWYFGRQRSKGHIGSKPFPIPGVRLWLTHNQLFQHTI
jgi:hypothetical protein